LPAWCRPCSVFAFLTRASRTGFSSMSREPLFVSYSHREEEFALRLAADLRMRGVNLWMDRLEIRAGDDWRRQVERAIDTCSGMIAIISPDAVAAEYCRKELVRAAERRVRIFGVLLRRVPRVPLDLQLVHQIDFSGSDEPARYQAALTTLLEDLRKTEEIGPELDREARYLVSLVAQMEHKRGVYSYIALAGEASASVPAARTRPRHLLDDWGLGPEFAILWSNGDSEQLADTSANTPDAEPVRLDLSSMIERHNRFVLLGNPGAGKTTTLYRLALDAARRRLTDRMATLPLLLRLPQWRGEPTFWEFLQNQWPFDSDPRQAGANTLLVLDGLNEMGATGGAKAASLRDFLRDSSLRVVVTCRTGDYDAALDLGLTRVTILPLDEDRVRQFARTYLETKADAFLIQIGMPVSSEDGWLASAPARQPLARLAANPYLLVGLMAIARRSTEGLPSNPGALFRQLVAVLWKREGLLNTSGWIPLEALLPRLGGLARHAIEEGLSTELPASLVADYIDAAQVRAACAATLLEQSGQGIRFYHQLIEEYCAAEELDNADLAGRIAPPVFESSGRRRGPWDEVIIAKCGLADPADPLVDAIAAVDPFLAAEAAASGANVTAPARSRLVEILIGEMQKEKNTWPGDRTAAAIRAAGLIKAREALPHLIDALRIGNTGIVSDACSALAQIGDPAAAQPLIDLLRGWRHPHPGLQPTSMRRKIYGILADAAAKALVQLGEPGVPHLLEALRRDPRLTEAVLFILGRIGDPRAIPAIMDCVREHPVRTVRAFGYQALGRLRAAVAVPLLKTAMGTRGDAASAEFPSVVMLAHAETGTGLPDFRCPPPVHAARALALIGDDEARAALRDAGLPAEPVPLALGRRRWLAYQ
jgi:HEAT repeat protein